MSETPEAIEATCESCEATTTFEWDQRGRVVDCPVCGGYLDVPDPLEEFDFPDEPLTPLPEREDLGFRFVMQEGLPRPDWETIQQRHPWQQNNPQFAETYQEVIRFWLESLAAYLPMAHEVIRSENFVALLPSNRLKPDEFAKTLENYFGQIQSLLPGAACSFGDGLNAVLLFENQNVYYRHIAPYFSEGEHGGSGGIFIKADFPHIAIPFTPWHWRPTLAHEMTHMLLQHLSLPAWLDEGVTQLVETTVSQSAHFNPTHESMRKQKKFWREHGLQEFWTGKAFQRPDEGQECAYELAEILVRNLRSRSATALSPLLNEAAAEDAGNAALVAAYRSSLSDIVTEILGEGDWEPRLPLDIDDELHASSTGGGASIRVRLDAPR